MASTAPSFQEQDRIISAIESASDAELSALADISTQLQKINTGGDGLTIKRPSRTSHVDRTPPRNSLGLKLVEKKQAFGKTENEKQKEFISGSNKAQSERKNRNPKNNDKNRVILDSNNPKYGAKKDANDFNDKTTPNSVSLKTYLDNKKDLNSNKKSMASAAVERIATEIKPRPIPTIRDNRGEKAAERQRTASGRFASKDKNESLNVKKTNDSERKANEKMQAGFLRRLGGVIGDSTKSFAEAGDNSAIDVAGSAGGSFWKAGKEAAGLVSNVKDNVVSMHDWVQGKREEIKPAVKQATIQTPSIQPLKFGGDKETTSAKEFSAQNQTQQTKAIQEQTKLNQVNDEKMIGLLEDIADKKGGSAGGGILDKLFGAMAIKSIGKKIGAKLGSAILAGLGIKKLRSLFSKGSKDGSGDIDIDTGRSGKSKKGKKGKGKAKKLKKGNPLKRLLKGKVAAKAATAAVATGGAAYAGKKILESTGEQAGEVATKKVANKEVEKTTAKTAEKIVEKESPKVAQKGATKAASKGTEKIAEKSTAKVAEKGAEKVAEKGAVKAAGKLATKTALKAVPLVGTAISAGMDAYDGFSDTDAQRETFGLKEGEQVSTRHKSEYALANVADMGGLVSGGAGLLADGAKYLGMDSVADSLTFDTGDIAKSIDGKVSGVISLFTSDSKKTAESNAKQSESNKADIVKAVTEGADKTTKAINDLSTQMFGGKIGEDGIAVPTGGNMPSAPTENIFGDGLNIGGNNAKNRNFRNNNFGNLAFVGQKGARLEDANSKGEQRFAKFDTPEEGMRALATQITSYTNGTSKAANYQKLNTVESIISKYAPANENNTKAYIANLSKSLGVSSTDQLDLSNPQAMAKMIRGISTIEGGNPQVTDKFIESSIGSYNEKSKTWEGQFSPETLAYVNKARAGKGLKEITAQDQYSSPEAVGGKAAAKVTQQKALKPEQQLTSSKADVAKPKVPEVKPEQSTKSKTATPKDKPQESKSKQQAEAKTKESPATNKSGSGFWDKVKGLRDSADNKIAGYAENVQGVRAIKPDAGLTLPKNMKASDLPAGLQIAMLPANQIAQASKSKRIENQARAQAPRGAIYSGQSMPVGASTVPVSAPQAIKNAEMETVYSVNDLNKALPADYKPQSQGQTSADPKKAENEPSTFGKFSQSLADIVLPSAADTFKDMTQGFSSGGMIDGVLNNIGLSGSQTRALSPLTGFMSKKIDSGVHGMTDSVANTIRQPASLTLPKSLHTVTDLAASGVKTPVTRDKATSSNDNAMLSELQKIVASIEKLLGVQKEANNKGKDPNTTTNSAQPAPRSDIPLGSSVDALSQLLSDRN